MPNQTTYNADPAVAFEGMVADTGLAVIISRTVKANPLGFGKAVVNGATVHTVRATESGDADILGVSVRSQATAADSIVAYPVNDTAAILLEGAIWVKVGEAVAFGDKAYVTTDGGAFTKTEAGNVALPNASYETSASADGLALLRIVLEDA